MTLVEEIQLLVEAHDRMYALGVPSPFLDKLKLLIDGKIEAEGERILAMTQEEVFAECRARGECPHEVAARIRNLLLGAFDREPEAKPSAVSCDDCGNPECTCPMGCLCCPGGDCQNL